MSAPLKAGVIGCGVFGGHHARKYVALDGVTLTAVYDRDLARAEALAAETGGRAYDNLDAFLAEVDLLSIATLATAHAAPGLAALRAGRHVLMEKPLAATLDQADQLIAAADRAGVLLATGLQERVLAEALGLFGLPEHPLRIDSVRHSEPSGRSLDVSCVLDLTIHDLDTALALSGAEPIAVEGEGRGEPGGRLDAVQAEVTFADGLTLSVDTSRIAPARDRRVTLTYPSGEVSLDLIARTVRNTTPFALNAAFADTPVGRDPLHASVAAFVAAVRGEGAPVATAADGARALDLALAVEQACGG